jgi:hypothetical protein
MLRYLRIFAFTKFAHFHNEIEEISRIRRKGIYSN